MLIFPNAGELPHCIGRRTSPACWNDLNGDPNRSGNADLLKNESVCSSLQIAPQDSPSAGCFCRLIRRVLLDCRARLVSQPESEGQPFLSNSSGGRRKSSTRFSTVIFLSGQPRSGKTSLLYRLKLDDFIPTTPTASPVTEIFKLRFTCVNHSHQKGGIAPLVSSPSAKFHSCQLVHEKVKIFDVGRVVHNYATMEMSDTSTAPYDNDRRHLCASPLNDEYGFNDYSLPHSLSSSTASSSPKLHTPRQLRTRELAPPDQRRENAPIFPPWASSVIPACDCAIVVLDATSSASAISECREEIVFLLFNDSFMAKNGKVAILLNKSDVNGSLGAEEVSDLLGLSPSLRKRRWAVFTTSAISGEGVSDALAWLLADSIEQCYLDDALLRCSDFQSGIEGIQSSQVEDYPMDRGVTVQPCLSACKFRLIPNNALLDRFNFEEIGAKRLINPFYLPSESQKATVEKSSSISMTGLATAESFHFMDRRSSSEDAKQSCSNSQPQPQLIGRNSDKEALLQ